MNYILPELDRLHKTQIDFLHSDEKCHMFFRRHGIYLLFSLGKHWISFLFLFLLILPFSIWLFGENWTEFSTAIIIFGIISALGVFLLHWLFLDIIGYFLGFMMVTDCRIIEFHKTVFLREEMKEIPFRQITNIHHEKNGFMQNILNYGVLRIHSNVQEPVRMQFVPHVEEKFSKISAFYAKYSDKNNYEEDADAETEQERTERIRKRDRFIYRPLQKIVGKIGRGK